MKKNKLISILLMTGLIIYALFSFLPEEKEKVILLECIDGDTAHFEVNGKDEKVRFLAINTPEVDTDPEKSEPFGEAAASYTCKALKEADEITLEFDEKADRDHYGRLLAWVFVDGRLLQEELISKGYAEVKYIYDDYRYVEELRLAQKKAEAEKAGMWK